jgi:hypothetical protein
VVDAAFDDENGLLPGRGVGVAGRETGVAPSTIFCNSGGKSSTLTVFFGAAFFAGAFFAFGAASAGTKSGNLSINLRTTGASTVDDAERTNSPTSCSFASSSLLSSPNSLANSYTRTLATLLLLLAPRYLRASLNRPTHNLVVLIRVSFSLASYLFLIT